MAIQETHRFASRPLDEPSSASPLASTTTTPSTMMALRQQLSAWEIAVVAVVWQQW